MAKKFQYRASDIEVAVTPLDYYQTCAIPKPPKRVKTPKRAIRVKAKPKGERDRVAETHQYCFGRERDTCRACRSRLGQSMHEIIPRSRGGKISRRNSIAVCGELGNGHECHGLCQRGELQVTMGPEGAEGTLIFTAKTRAAADWLKIKIGESIESQPMVYLEAAE